MGKNHTNSFENTVLLEIRRRYSKDESFKFLFGTLKNRDDKIRELSFTIGEQKSEIAELQHENKLLKTDYSAKMMLVESEEVKAARNAVDRIRKEKNKAEKDAAEWQRKYLSLFAKSLLEK